MGVYPSSTLSALPLFAALRLRAMYILHAPNNGCGGRLKTMRLTVKYTLNFEVRLTPGVYGVFEKERRRSPAYMCISTCTLGGSGGMFPQEILDFRLSVTAFSGSL